MSTTDASPGECTLGATGSRERRAWIAQLNRDGLRAHRCNGQTLELRYVAAVRDRVHQLLQLEAECCAFLKFSVAESQSEMTVTITVPTRHAAIAGDLLAPFLPSGDSAENRSVMCNSSGYAACCLPRDEPASSLRNQ